MPPEPLVGETRIFQASRVLTMNTSLSLATHIAARDGRVLGVGGPELIDAFGPATLDDRFAGNVIVPGFVEGHGHAADGLMWRNPYVGYFPRTAPDGSRHTGFRSIAELIDHLRAIEAAMTDPDRPLVAWGFDPIYFNGPRLTCADLDAISTRRMIVVAHVSGLILNVNSTVLERAGFSADSNLRGLVRDAAGQLTGELQGPAAMGRANRFTGEAGLSRAPDVAALRDFSVLTRRVGVTTATDLANLLTDGTVDARCRIVMNFSRCSMRLWLPVMALPRLDRGIDRTVWCDTIRPLRQLLGTAFHSSSSDLFRGSIAALCWYRSP